MLHTRGHAVSSCCAACAVAVLLPTLFLAGFACLPWLWAVNVWMFWPDFKHGDPVVKACEYGSAALQDGGDQGRLGCSCMVCLLHRPRMPAVHHDEKQLVHTPPMSGR